MVYYTRDGRILNYDLNNKTTINGRQGNIYKLENGICLKEYNIDSESKSIFDDVGTKFNQEMFDYFKGNFSDSCMGELYDLLYDERFTNVLGYTMRYYEEVLDNILEMPISYIIDNFSLIYDMVSRLTLECVRIVDLHYGNIINTDNGMVIIDYDKYRFDYESTNEVLEFINKSALMNTFYGIFKNSLKRMGIDVDSNMELKNRLSSLFTIDTTPLVLKYRLCRYNKPIDYIINYR